MNKNLLVFFGEYRYFNFSVLKLKNLEKVDILFSTWDYCMVNQKDITIHDIQKYIPNANIILNKANNPKFLHKSKAFKMFFNWKISLNSLNEKIFNYEKIILHRCDAVSNYHTLLEKKFDDNTLYLEIKNKDTLHINDYIIASDPITILKFVNCFNKDNYLDDTEILNGLHTPHKDIKDVILKNNFKYKQIPVLCFIIRNPETDLNHEI